MRTISKTETETVAGGMNPFLWPLVIVMIPPLGGGDDKKDEE